MLNKYKLTYSSSDIHSKSIIIEAFSAEDAVFQLKTNILDLDHSYRFRPREQVNLMVTKIEPCGEDYKI